MPRVMLQSTNSSEGVIRPEIIALPQTLQINRLTYFSVK